MTERKPNKDPQYFTAILQLRNMNDDMERFLKNAVRKDKEGVFISKVIEERNGKDYYLSSNKFARKVTRELISHFGGKFSENERLFSYNKETSRNIYRMNILVEFPLFSRNEIILFNGKPYLVKVVGKNVSLDDLSAGKSTVVEYKKIKDFRKLERVETRVVKVYPTLSVFDENHDEIIVANKPKKELKPGEKVKVVFSDGCYIL